MQYSYIPTSMTTSSFNPSWGTLTSIIDIKRTYIFTAKSDTSFKGVGGGGGSDRQI